MTDVVMKNIRLSFGDKRIWEDFSAVFPAGRVTCLMGPSGCGKTTLLRILLGLLPPDGGTVTGRPERLSAVFQEDRLCEALTPAANVRLVTGGSVPAAETETLLRRLGLGDSLRTPARELSGGMRRRTALARALLAPGWELLALDEPFKGLDAETRRRTAELIREYGAGKTVVLVTHDPEEAALLGGAILPLGKS